MKAIICYVLLISVCIACAPVNSINSNIGIQQVYKYPLYQTPIKENVPALSDMLQVSSQFFTITSYADTILRGKEGTEITLHPVCLHSEVQANPMIPFRVELKELYSKSALLKEKAYTISNGALLESDGSLYIQAIDAEGKNLMISCDEAITISIPRSLDPTMQYFEGNLDATGNMNWNLTESIIPIETSEPIFTDGEERWLGENPEFRPSSENNPGNRKLFFLAQKIWLDQL